MPNGTFVGVQGPLTGMRFTLGGAPLTFGRDAANDVVLPSELASRFHAEIRYEAGAGVLQDRSSSNGTWVNGTRVSSYRLRHDDLIVMGDDVFRFEAFAAQPTALVAPLVPPSEQPLRVLVTGGGPVGLSFALLLEDLLGSRVDVTVYDGRWTKAGEEVVWKTPEQGNARRQQVVTIQSL